METIPKKSRYYFILKQIVKKEYLTKYLCQEQNLL